MFAVERGHNFLHAVSRANSLCRQTNDSSKWVTRALGSGMVRPSTYWNEKCRAVFAPKPDSKPQDLQTAAACWDEYKNVMGASPIDCLLVEESAKVCDHDPAYLSDTDLIGLAG